MNLYPFILFLLNEIGFPFVFLSYKFIILLSFVFKLPFQPYVEKS
jgi:hypothetical protein